MSDSCCPVRVNVVEGSADLRRFVEFPWKVYGRDPNWVPPIRREFRRLLDVSRHPFWEFSERELFLARRGDEVVGRLAAIIDHRHNQRFSERMGSWGFFECQDDGEAAHELFRAADCWVRSRGMESIRGPLNPSFNYESGLLVENFAYPPTLGLTYNPPYYPLLVEGCGFSKCKDLHSFRIDRNLKIPDWVFPLVNDLQQKHGLWIRQGRVADYDNEVRRIGELYNAIWDKNWAFVPLTSAEIQEMERNLRLVADPEAVIFVQHGDESIGVGFALPDWNQVLRRLDGKLGLRGLIKVLRHRRKISGLRGFIFGVKEEYRELGAPFLAFAHSLRHLTERRNYQYMELGWILEDNEAILQFIEAGGLKVFRRYRIYQKAL